LISLARFNIVASAEGFFNNYNLKSFVITQYQKAEMIITPKITPKTPTTFINLTPNTSISF
jgi:hypothetical protein